MNNRGTGKYEQLLDRCAKLEAVPTAVAHPCKASSLAGAMDAAGKGLIRPILVGPAGRIRDVAEQAQITLGDVEIVDTPHSHESGVQAVQLVRTGRAELLMKGSLHTDELMAAVVSRNAGLRTERRISHTFVMDVPTYHKVLIVTAGIGENSAEVRRRICEASSWLGVRLDTEANEAHGPRITSRDSEVSAWVIPTNEELMIARHTADQLACLSHHASCSFP